MRKLLLLCKILTDATWGKYKMQLEDKIDPTYVQDILDIRWTSIKYKVLFVLILLVHVLINSLVYQCFISNYIFFLVGLIINIMLIVWNIEK